MEVEEEKVEEEKMIGGSCQESPESREPCGKSEVQASSSVRVP